MGGIDINDVHPPRVIGWLSLILVVNRISCFRGISSWEARGFAHRRHLLAEAFLAKCNCNIAQEYVL